VSPNIRKALLRIFEVALLIPAFGILIPPVPSELDETYPLFPRLAIGGGLFALSMAFACLRCGEHWAIALLKLALFLAFGWLVHERVWM
jgi:hypothetical protein